MPLMRTCTTKGEVIIDDGKSEIKLTKAEIENRKGRDDQVKGEMEAKAGRAIDVPVFFRKHAVTGRMMIVTGEPQPEWPDGTKWDAK